jgi:Fe2+ or Zn2+ uptake regulation protein
VEYSLHTARHYLVCRNCGDVPIDAHPVTTGPPTTAAEHDFADVHPIVELAGHCPACHYGGWGDARPSR